MTAVQPVGTVPGESWSKLSHSAVLAQLPLPPPPPSAFSLEVDPPASVAPTVDVPVPPDMEGLLAPVELTEPL